jgi:glutamate formiminotransferase / 5-formyltetrahydrofolate cyclo-ligase
VTTLLAVPNVSEGRDGAVLDALGAAFAQRARLLDVHTDPDHHRSVFTMAGAPGTLHEALLGGAGEAVARIDVSAHEGEHPRIGAIDVAPIVYLHEADRGAACAEALLTADGLAHHLGIPVFLYGELAGGRTRAELRRGGPQRLAERIAAGELKPDYGPPRLHPTAGATLVAARPPLVAFNVVIEDSTLDTARSIAAAIREGGPEGLPGVRAIGLELRTQGLTQVSTNIEDHTRVTAAQVVEAVRRHAPVTSAELVALAPRAALRDFPPDVPLSGAGNVIEDALGR